MFRGKYVTHPWEIKPAMPREYLFSSDESNCFQAVTSTYLQAAVFPFEGYAHAGQPALVKLIMTVDPATVGGFRLYDRTNARTMVESTNINPTTQAVTILAPLANIPELPSVLEIQIRRVSGLPSSKVYLHYFGLFW